MLCRYPVLIKVLHIDQYLCELPKEVYGGKVCSGLSVNRDREKHTVFNVECYSVTRRDSCEARRSLGIVQIKKE